MPQQDTRKVLVGVPDLFFASKIRETAGQVGANVEFAGSQRDLLNGACASPTLIILDLNGDSLEPIPIIRKLKGEPASKDVPVLGFVSHVQADLIQAATAAGCDRVLSRSAFVRELPGILRLYETTSHAGREG